MTWIKQFTRSNKPRDAEKLLTAQQTVEWNALGAFAKHLHISVTITLAVVGASLAAVTSDHAVIILAAFGGPILVAGVRWFSIASLDRYYGRFLEAIAVQRKLRYVVEAPADMCVPCSKDATLDVSRYWENEPTDKSSRFIAKKMSEGHNKIAWLFFRWIFLLSFAPDVLAIVRIRSWLESNNFARWVVVGILAVVTIVVAWLAYFCGTCWIKKQRRKSYGPPIKRQHSVCDTARHN